MFFFGSGGFFTLRLQYSLSLYGPPTPSAHKQQACAHHPKISLSSMRGIKHNCRHNTARSTPSRLHPPLRLPKAPVVRRLRSASRRAVDAVRGETTRAPRTRSPREAARDEALHLDARHGNLQTVVTRATRKRRPGARVDYYICY